MPVPVYVPTDLWDDDREAVIVTWLYEEGAAVEADAIIATLALEKVQIEVVTPVAGRLCQKKAAESSVTRGMLIAEII